MTIIERLCQLYEQQNPSLRGWIVVSEREFNAYFHSFGPLHTYAFACGKSMHTLLFRGCQLRVL